MTGKSEPYDIAEGLETPHMVAIFLADAFDLGDPAFAAHALGIVARSRGMTEIAKKTGLSREALYRSLTENGNPSLKSLMSVLDALDLKLSVQAKKEHGVGQEERLKA